MNLSGNLPVSAIVFESQEDAVAGILGGKVKEGHVVSHPLRRSKRRPGYARNVVSNQLLKIDGLR